MFLDDWAAVYAKDTPDNKAVIAQNEYRYLTPERLATDSWLGKISVKDAPAVEMEFRRAVRESPNAVIVRLLLALESSYVKRLDEAVALAEDARKLQPYRPATYQVLWSLCAAKKDWAAAAIVPLESLPLLF